MRNYTIIGAKAKTEKDRRKERERTQDERRERFSRQVFPL
jgi:hypothetical protein